MNWIICVDCGHDWVDGAVECEKCGSDNVWEDVL